MCVPHGAAQGGLERQLFGSKIGRFLNCPAGAGLNKKSEFWFTLQQYRTAKSLRYKQEVYLLHYEEALT